jgi:hypothetical protein
VLTLRRDRVLPMETPGLPNFERTRSFDRKCGYDKGARIRNFYKTGNDKIIYCKTLVAKED